MVTVFNKPKSFTGEDMVEFHIHGGTAVKTKMLEVLDKLDGFRPAEPVRFCIHFQGRIYKKSFVEWKT